MTQRVIQPENRNPGEMSAEVAARFRLIANAIALILVVLMVFAAQHEPIVAICGIAIIGFTWHGALESIKVRAPKSNPDEDSELEI